MRRMRSGSLLLVLAAGALAIAGCASSQRVARTDFSTLEWPTGNPRVRLESVIRSRHDLGRRDVFSWVVGRRAEALFTRPHGVAWDGEDLIVTDPAARRILRIGKGGQVKFSPVGVVEEPIGVAACSRGLIVTDVGSGGVALVDRQLRFVRWLAEDLDRPTGVACHGEVVWVVETGAQRIVALAGDGRRSFGQRGAEPGEFNYPTAAAFGNGRLYVGDTLNFRIQSLDPETGTALDSFGRLGDAPGEMPRIKGVAVDKSGHVWVSDAFLDMVSIYSADGGYLLGIGRQGIGPAEFAFPAGIAAHPDGRIAVVDSLNRRIQVFRVVEPPPEGED